MIKKLHNKTYYIRFDFTLLAIHLLLIIPTYSQNHQVPVESGLQLREDGQREQGVRAAGEVGDGADPVCGDAASGGAAAAGAEGAGGAGERE